MRTVLKCSSRATVSASRWKRAFTEGSCDHSGLSSLTATARCAEPRVCSAAYTSLRHKSIAPRHRLTDEALRRGSGGRGAALATEVSRLWHLLTTLRAS